MLKVIAVPIVMLILFLAYTIHSNDISPREIHEHNHKIVVYSKAKCPYCTKATALLEHKKVQYYEIDITWDEERTQKLAMETNVRTVPYIFVDGKYIGGYSDLVKFVDHGGLL